MKGFEFVRDGEKLEVFGRGHVWRFNTGEVTTGSFLTSPVVSIEEEYFIVQAFRLLPQGKVLLVTNIYRYDEYMPFRIDLEEVSDFCGKAVKMLLSGDNKTQ